MTIEYSEESVCVKYEDFDTLSKMFNKDIAKNFNRFKICILASENLYKLGKMRPGLNIEKIKGFKRLYSARLNHKYRVEFKVKEELAIKVKRISVVRIHPHKYKRR